MTDARPLVDLLLRKSKIVREGEQALSLRAQEDRGRRWADENGYQVRRVWKENLSAWSDVQRPQYDAAMAAILGGETNALWCAFLDRFSRKGAEAVVPILGTARVIFDYERLDSSNERDRRWIIQRAEDAYEYSQRLSHNVRTTKDRQRRESRWLSAAPFGLEINDPKDRKIRPAERWGVIEDVFYQVAGGKAARALAREYNSAGMRTATGKDFTAGTVRDIVDNPVYEGWQVGSGGKGQKRRQAYRDDKGHKISVAEDMARMIPADVAERARRVLHGHQLPEGFRPGRTLHLLTDLVRCAGCGSAMSASGQSTACSRNMHGGVCPAPASVKRMTLEQYVTKEWQWRIGELEMGDPLMIAVAQRWQALNAPEETEEAREAVAAVKAAEAAVQRLVEDRQAGLYDGAAGKHYPRLLKQAEADLMAAQERQAKFAGPRIDLTMFDDVVMFQQMWEVSDLSAKRDLLRLAIDRVTVTKAPGQGHKFVGKERVTIEWAEPEQAV
ncbi:recombinase family protein [Streptomyces sp. NPDC039016]|uniref:recombinase family protein n=1 Tax=Streptomyces sp. NPDC039016 TaxID=3154330 RepID=UPI00340E7D85